MQNQIDFSGLYIISDDILTPKNQLLEKIKLSLEGGAKIVQLRDKISSDYEIEEISDDLQKL
jgi:thiamine-phosphate pyrophosphorylase